MSRRYQSPYNGKQYLLNTNTDEVHDLDNEQDGCNIDQIATYNIIMFDDLDSALKYPNSYTNHNDGCFYCLKKYHTK